jgi:hypothetical protein
MKKRMRNLTAAAMFATACFVTLFLGGCARTVAVDYSFELERPAAVVDYQNPAFKSGERFRVNLMAEQDCYLYLLNEGTDGAFTFLFPLHGVQGGENFVRAHEWVEIPSTGWYRLDEKAGIERLIVVASLKAVGSLESLRNRTDLDPNEMRALLKSIDDVYNVKMHDQTREPLVDRVRQSVSSRDEFPVLDFRIDMVHE